ncbi:MULTISPECIES: SRPBCC family protein [Streptomyces]|uniref:Cyclase n=1 Tax=Streptomyces dengpaensis TaxID=2049881 RepID=A0ABN5HVE7_9ACTN|nr:MULTISPECIES: SRPBCC family protein [Streptomyces]AVH55110.1 cyclase [Streptomyces dengpaensis]PIB08408.1 cyclase [Streptomyces sp. HG99]
MNTIQESVEIAVPVRTAYDQWTQFKSFPRFMSAVKRVDQVSPAMTRWAVRVGPWRREFRAEIVEQEPDSLVAWRSTERDPWHWGEVSFRSMAPDRTVVTVRMQVRPRGVVGRLTDPSKMTRRVVRDELGNFKEFIEGLGDASGAWRGSIRNGRVRPAEPEPPRSRVPKWPVG